MIFLQKPGIEKKKMNVVKFTPQIFYLNLETKFIYQKLIANELLQI